MIRVTASLAFAFCLAVAGAGARAQDGSGPLRAVLLSPMPEGVEARIAGQTGDLPWQTMRVDSRADAGDAGRARRVAVERGAQAVIGVREGDAGALVLAVYDARRDRVEQRVFAREGDSARARSAQLEAVALAVRGTLKVMGVERSGSGTGAVSGSVSGTGAGTGTGTGTGAVSGSVSATGSVSGTGSGSGTGTGAGTGAGTESGTGAGAASATGLGKGLGSGTGVALGWWLAADGVSSGQHGPFVSLVWSPGAAPLLLELRGHASLGADAGDRRAQVTLKRHVVLVGAALRLGLGPALELRPGLHAGLVHLRRSTDSTDPSLAATGASSDTGLGLEASLGLRVALARWSWGRLGLLLGGHALLTPRRTSLRYELADGDTVDRPLDRLSPGASAGLSLNLP